MQVGSTKVRLVYFILAPQLNPRPPNAASARFARPCIQGADILRKLYPGHSLIMSQDFFLNLLGFPHAIAIPLKPDELITNNFFVDLGRGAGGALVGNVEFVCFKMAW